MAHKLKIAFVGLKGIPATWGGVEHATEELAVRLARYGYEVRVYCRRWYTKNMPLEYRGVRLFYTPSIQTKHLDTITHTFFSVWHALRQHVDVIHFQGIGPALLAWMPRIFSRRVKVVVTFHCFDRRLEKWGMFARLAFLLGELVAMKCAHEIQVTSKFLQAYTTHVWGRETTYVPNGAFSEAEAPAKDLLLPWNLEPFQYVISLGRFIPDKAQDEAIAAFMQMKSALGAQARNLQLILIGEEMHGAKYTRQLELAAGGRDDIIFAGTQTGAVLRALLCYAAAAVQPSHSEGMPLAVLELASLGVPLVLSDIAAHREIFGDEYDYVRVGDVTGLAAGLGGKVAQLAAAQNLAHKFKKKVAEEYRWEVIAARYQVSLVALLAEPLVAA